MMCVSKRLLLLLIASHQVASLNVHQSKGDAYVRKAGVSAGVSTSGLDYADNYISASFPNTLGGTESVVWDSPGSWDDDVSGKYGGRYRGNVCFSGESTVNVEHNTFPVSMKDLQLGDRVLTGHGSYHPIYAFGYRHESKTTTFLRISTTSNDAPLEISGEHMVYVEGKASPVRAASLRVGDSLIQVEPTGVKSSVVIDQMTYVTRHGVYAPITQWGTLVVNGILSSSYVAVQKGTDYVQLGTNYDQPIFIPWLHQAHAIHVWLSPLRLVCWLVSPIFCGPSFHSKENGMHLYIEMLMHLVTPSETESIVRQMLVILLLYALTVPFWFLECLIYASHGSIFLLLAAVVAWYLLARPS